MDYRQVDRFLHTVSAPTLRQYFASFADLPVDGLQRRLEWAARYRYHPGAAGEAEFLLTHHLALREVLQDPTLQHHPVGPSTERRVVERTEDVIGPPPPVAFLTEFPEEFGVGEAVHPEEEEPFTGDAWGPDLVEIGDDALEALGGEPLEELPALALEELHRGPRPIRIETVRLEPVIQVVEGRLSQALMIICIGLIGIIIGLLIPRPIAGVQPWQVAAPPPPVPVEAEPLPAEPVEPIDVLPPLELDDVGE